MTEDELGLAAEDALVTAGAAIMSKQPTPVVLECCRAAKTALDAYNNEQTFPCSDSLFELPELMREFGYSAADVQAATEIAEG
jgi:hypothetical protein